MASLRTVEKSVGKMAANGGDVTKCKPFVIKKAQEPLVKLPIVPPKEREAAPQPYKANGQVNISKVAYEKFDL